MTFRYPDQVMLRSLTSVTSADGVGFDFTPQATDGDLGRSFCRIAKGMQDCLSVQFDDGVDGIAAGDFIRFYCKKKRNDMDMSIYHYDTDNTIKTSTGIHVLGGDINGGSWITFTLDQAFVDDRVDLGAGRWKVRFVGDSIAIDSVEISEVEGDLSEGAPPGDGVERYSLLRKTLKAFSNRGMRAARVRGIRRSIWR